MAESGQKTLRVARRPGAPVERVLLCAVCAYPGGTLVKRDGLYVHAKCAKEML